MICKPLVVSVGYTFLYQCKIFHHYSALYNQRCHSLFHRFYFSVFHVFSKRHLDFRTLKKCFPCAIYYLHLISFYLVTPSLITGDFFQKFSQIFSSYFLFQKLSAYLISCNCNWQIQ